MKMSHMRRNKLSGPTLNLEHDMTCKLKKEDFLSNDSGHTVYHSSGDADCLIVKTAFESAQNTNTVLIGDDTDLLVMLIHHAEPNGHGLYFKIWTACSGNLEHNLTISIVAEGALLRRSALKPARI